jgi:hypothetical protein
MRTKTVARRVMMLNIFGLQTKKCNFRAN